MVQEGTGFSPNGLVFGHSVRGPLAVLCDAVAQSTELLSNLIDYVNGFRHRLYLAGAFVQPESCVPLVLVTKFWH